MFHSTLPPIYFSTTSTLLLAASSTGMRPPSRAGHALGVCEIMDSSNDQELSFSPITGLQVYLAIGGKKDQPLIDSDDAKVDIVRQPRHGHIELLGDWSGAEYVPDE